MIFVTTLKTKKPGDPFIIEYGKYGKKLDTSQPCIVIREATFEEYIEYVKQSYPDNDIPSYMRKEVAVAQNRKFYAVSTD